VDTADILRMRLASQLIVRSPAENPHAVVSRLLAMQAQDHAGALWAIGLRTPGATQAAIEKTIAERTIVRTWPMRGTLHFVAAEDVRWLLHLLAPRISARYATRRRDLGLDERQLSRARELLISALEGGRSLTRPRVMELLESGGVTTAGQAGYHVLVQLAHEGLLVQGPMRDKQQTFVLLEEWVPRTPESDTAESRPRKESLAVLAERYFTGHGPATVADLARWGSITRRDAVAALDAVADNLAFAEHEGERYWFAPQAGEDRTRGGASTSSGGGRAKPGTVAPSVRLLPGFDEYMLGYVGRGQQLGPFLEEYGSKVAANGMLAPAIVIDGRAVGIWKRTLRTRTVAFEITPFRKLTTAEKTGISREQTRYAAFVGRSAERSE
jgi:hypothetical protein